MEYACLTILMPVQTSAIQAEDVPLLKLIHNEDKNMVKVQENGSLSRALQDLDNLKYFKFQSFVKRQGASVFHGIHKLKWAILQIDFCENATILHQL